MKIKNWRLSLVAILLIGAVMAGAGLVGNIFPDKAALQAAEVKNREAEDRTTDEAGKGQKDAAASESPSAGSTESPEGEAPDPAAVKDRLLVIDGQGNVEVGVTFENPLQDDQEYLVFRTQLNTHSVDLDGYDYGKLATIQTSEGIRITDGIIWEKPEGDVHHFVGYYKVPRIIDGKDILTRDTAYLELRITGIDRVEDRTFRWEKEVLDLIPTI